MYPGEGTFQQLLQKLCSWKISSWQKISSFLSHVGFKAGASIEGSISTVLRIFRLTILHILFPNAWVLVLCFYKSNIWTEAKKMLIYNEFPIRGCILTEFRNTEHHSVIFLFLTSALVGSRQMLVTQANSHPSSWEPSKMWHSNRCGKRVLYKFFIS